VLLTAQPLCAFDRAVLFEDVGVADQPWLLGALDHDASEPPSILALKARALAAQGHLDEGRALLRRLAPDALVQLPCDSQYLGTLGHLTRAALTLHASEYFEPLCELLGRYPSYFSAQISFLCEGSVQSLMGRLLLALGRTADATVALRAGLAAEHGQGLLRCATESQAVLDQAVAEQKGAIAPLS